MGERKFSLSWASVTVIARKRPPPCHTNPSSFLSVSFLFFPLLFRTSSPNPVRLSGGGSDVSFPSGRKRIFYTFWALRTHPTATFSIAHVQCILLFCRFVKWKKRSQFNFSDLSFPPVTGVDASAVDHLTGGFNFLTSLG